MTGEHEGKPPLPALIDAQKKGIIKDGKICLVISNNKDAYALERAKNNGIKSVAIVKKDLDGDQKAFENEIINQLEKHDIKLIVLAGFLAILSQDFTQKYANRIINVHPSLIPAFCGKGYYGLKVHQEAFNSPFSSTSILSAS